jgi:hypothetical protein
LSPERVRGELFAATGVRATCQVFASLGFSFSPLGRCLLCPGG